MKTAGLFAFAFGLGAAACSSSATEEAVPMARSQALRVTSPSVPAADAEALRDGNATFAFDLYRPLAAATPDANVFYSPYSISLALAMTYAGARGTTATEMASALHFTLPQAQLHPALNALDLALASRGEVAKGGDDAKPFRLTIANSLWGALDGAFQPAFLDTLATNYGTGVRLVDFARPAEAAARINGWVSDTTEKRITELVPATALSADTRLVLVNAIYFNAAWTTPFEKAATTPGTFHARAGDIPGSMMHATTSLGHVKGAGFEAVSVPYAAGLSLVAVLPDDEASFALDLPTWKTITSGLSSTLVALTMPKVEIDGKSFSLAKTLDGLGMKSAFLAGTADLSGIEGAPGERFISDVLHEAFVSIDETGTEAAAATAVIVNRDSSAALPSDPVTVSLDRPFRFAIRDDATGAILFVGRVVTL